MLAALAWGLASQAGLSGAAAATAGVTTLCAVWWVTEALPIPATSLIPFAALPLLGVLKSDDVARAYGHDLILLLLGGFILSTALERSGAHRRLAVAMVALVGGHSPRRVLLGVMLACAGLSMWISNTATTLMMLPVVLACVEGCRRPDGLNPVAAPLLIGVAWASSIGGLGTPVGTPPNVVLLGALQELTGESLSFLGWMRLGVPSVLVLLPLAYGLLARQLGPGEVRPLPVEGAWSAPQRRVLGVFLLTALAWITRVEPWGGWTGALALPGVSDATVALAAVVLLFVLPDGDGGRLLDWESAERIPWGLLLLFGGGIAIARAFEVTGLSAALGGALAALGHAPPVVLIGAICLGVTFLTELTSNTATATLLMPVMASAAQAAGLEPLLLMAPTALSASCAFMLPVATAPNAVVFGTGLVPLRLMAVQGLWLNLLGALALTGVCWLVLGAGG